MVSGSRGCGGCTPSDRCTDLNYCCVDRREPSRQISCEGERRVLGRSSIVVGLPAIRRDRRAVATAGMPIRSILACTSLATGIFWRFGQMRCRSRQSRITTASTAHGPPHHHHRRHDECVRCRPKLDIVWINSS